MGSTTTTTTTTTGTVRGGQKRQEQQEQQADIGARARELVSYIQNGRIIEAMYEFYAPDVRMQENNNPPTAGLEANVERERQFVNSVRQWRSFNVESLAVDAERGRTLLQTNFEFEGTDGTVHRYDQVAVQTWRDGRIVHERFYYDTGAAAQQA